MMSILKVDTEIITSIASCPVGRAVILVIMYIEIFKSDVVVFIGNVFDITLTDSFQYRYFVYFPFDV